MNRFFKAYFIASLIYAVWFGVLMYAVDPMFLDVMECNTLPVDYLCVQSGYTRPFTTFLYPFLSIVIFSLVHAGIMKWRKRRSVKMIWFLVGCESLLLSALMVAMLARDGFVLSRDIGSGLTGTGFGSPPVVETAGSAAKAAVPTRQELTAVQISALRMTEAIMGDTSRSKKWS